MKQPLFGAMVVGILASVASQPVWAADKPAKSAGKEKSAGHCVHNCAGYASCKGNGSNSCKGQNSCANEGLVPKECSSKKTADACKATLDTKKNTMCTWYEK